MSPSAQELEQRAERAVRRGELLNALEIYEVLLTRLPDDERLRSRMEAVRSLLQPSELVHRRKPEPIPEVSAEPMTDAEQGELHAAEGRFVEAAQAYRRAVADNPGNELLQERLLDLMKLLPSHKSALDDGLAAAEVLERSAPGPGPDELDAHRSAKAADAVFRPEGQARQPAARPGAAPVQPKAAPVLPKAAPPVQPPVAPVQPEATPLPRDVVAMLKVLLERVHASRRARA